jgi:hypothetical protein
MKFGIILTVLVLVLAIACSKKSTSGGNNNLDCSAVPKTFSNDVFPITSTRCAISGCHNAGSNNGPGPLTNHTEIFNARFLIRSAVSSGLMPQGSTLTDAQIKTILCWIDNNAPNN